MPSTVLTTHAPDNVAIHVETIGGGSPLLFIHEFAGDHRSWEPQVQAFSDRYQCITYAARGYPPSDVPPDAGSYSQAHAVSDALSVLDGLGIEKAHLVGLSMGGFCALHLALQYPQRVTSVTIGGVGYGAPHNKRAAFQKECEVIARAFEQEGSAQVALRYAVGPARVQFELKDPRGHAEFARRLSKHSSIGSAGTMRGFQKARPSLYDFTEPFKDMTVPVLILVGDEDEGAIDPSIMLKRTIPTAGLMVFPKSGHTLNLEEPELFNHALSRFLEAVAAGVWVGRDPRSLATSTTGMDS